MARVTVEDCVEIVNNRFELVALASHRAKEIASGGHITVDRDNDKNPVVALREIAGRTVSIENLREALVRSCQKRLKTDHYEPDMDADDAPLNAEILEEIQSLNSSEEDELEEMDMDDIDNNDISFSDENLDVDD